MFNNWVSTTATKFNHVMSSFISSIYFREKYSSTILAGNLPLTCTRLVPAMRSTNVTLKYMLQ